MDLKDIAENMRDNQSSNSTPPRNKSENEGISGLEDLGREEDDNNILRNSDVMPRNDSMDNVLKPIKSNKDE